MKPKIIVATNPNGLIGYNGKLPWRKSADLKRFKATTMGGTLIMGRTTWESIGRPLPGRQTFVLTRTPGLKWEGVVTFSSLEEALQNMDGGPTWIAGGAEVYKTALPFCDELDITVVNDSVEDRLALEGSLTVAEKIVGLDWFHNDRPEHVAGFRLASEVVNETDPTLTHRLYVRV